MTAFYNEIDPFAAAWLRQLIEYGHIAPGIVDERSIEDIRPDELTDFTQVHWFAGIGVWSHALRSAGWSDDRPIWTASCPCQPFSAAGKGGGFDDERHLWPALYWHISQCRPEVIIGEQVASKDGLAWWQLVSSDLEIAGYANAAVDFCAASVGAPHIRQRLYWVGVADSEASSGWRIQRPGQSDGAGVGSARERPAGLRTDDGVADANGTRPLPAAHGRIRGSEESAGSWNGESVRSCDAIGMADSTGGRRGIERRPLGQGEIRHPDSGGNSLSGMADTNDTEWRTDLSRRHDGNGSDAGRSQGSGHAGIGSADGRMADAEGSRWQGEPLRQGTRGSSGGNESDSQPVRLADANGSNAGTERQQRSGQFGQQPQDSGPGQVGHDRRTSPTNGFWRDADWLFCRDGKWRPVEPSSQQMVDGSSTGVGRLRDNGASADADQEPQAQIVRHFPLAKNQVARTGRLRGYGNAIVAPQAAVFIEAVMDSIQTVKA